MGNFSVTGEWTKDLSLTSVTQSQCRPRLDVTNESSQLGKKLKANLLFRPRFRFHFLVSSQKTKGFIQNRKIIDAWKSRGKKNELLEKI